MPSATAQTLLNFIGANIHRLRVRRDLTQEKLAELAELDLRFLQRVERGQSNIGVEALAGLADALGVPVARLFRKAKLQPVTKGRPPGDRWKTSR